MRTRAAWAVAGLVVLLAFPGLPMGGTPGHRTTSSVQAVSPVPHTTSLLSSAASTLATAGPGWTHLTLGSGPTRRSDYALAFDPSAGAVVLFGGWNGRTYLGDTWMFHNGSWDQFASAGPAPRARASMAFDSALGTLVLFGGYNGSTYFGDLWNLTGTGWVRFPVHSPTRPAARAGAAMAFDPVDKALVLVGGTDGSPVGDEWALRGTNWTPLTTGAAPGNRSGASLAFDPGSGALVLFGGLAGGSRYLGETWRWQSGSWTNLTGSRGPSARADAAFEDDPVDGALVLFGGTNGSVFGDTWWWRSGNWTESYPPVSPPALDGARFALDPGGSGLLLFGGWGGTSTMNGTWAFRAAPTVASWESASVGPAPWTRQFPAMAFDPAIGGTLVFGGFNPAPLNSSTPYLNDTWELVGGRWSLLSTPAAPAPREGASAAFDPGVGGVVLFGGSNATLFFNDTWLFRGGTWSRLFTPVAPGARAVAGLAADPPDGGLLLFGGRSSGGGFGYDRDTWLFQRGIWTLRGGGASGPSARSSPQMAFDASSGNVVLFGGDGGSFSGASTPLNDTWAFRSGTWSNRTVGAGGPPPARFGGNLVFDPSVGAAILFGGSGVTGRTSDVWYFRAGVWSLDCSSCDATAPTTDPAVYDPGRGSVLAFAGSVVTPGDSFPRFAATLAWVPMPVVSTSTLPSGGTDVGLPVTAVAWSGGGIPPWSVAWTLPQGTVASGPEAGFVPDSVGSFPFTATLASEGNLTATGSGVVAVHEWPQVVLRSNVRSVAQRSPLVFVANVSGGTPPLSANFQNLPSGCGVVAGLNLTCRPNALGAFNVEVTVVDAAGANTSAFLLVNVTEAKGAPGPSAALQWATVGVIAGILLVVVVALWYRRRERIRRHERLLAARRTPPVPRT